jgi:hypothetical protein
MQSLELSLPQSPNGYSASAATPSARTALLFLGKKPSSQDHKLTQLLEFFGIVWKAVAVDEIGAGPPPLSRGQCCIFCSAPDLGRVFQDLEFRCALTVWMKEAHSVYIYGFEETDVCRNLLRFLTDDAQATVRHLNGPPESMSMTSNFSEICGPMSGMRVPIDAAKGEVLFGITPRAEKFQSIIKTSDGQVFVRVMCQGISFYLNSSSRIVDINSPAEKNFDVKEHFCDAVPITMYLKWAFRDVCWNSPETNACLVIDDPLLKPRYGFLNFRELLELMDEKSFTTAIAFIPWNWRRTDRHTVELLRSRSDRFSLAVHGCDHTGSEFATRSGSVLDSKIQAAKQRMNAFVERTSLPYDPIMVFPQGVFSPETGRALKLNGFVAAVNTEVAPWQSEANETTVRDLWDTAIMKYGSFPIFTRRYFSSGIENFAFDAILGKPCLIAAHHDVFKGHGRDLTDFVEKLNSLKWSLYWRSLGEALEHSFRVLTGGNEITTIRMFSESQIIENPSVKPREVMFMKQESEPERVRAVTVNQNPIDYNCEDGYLRFRFPLLPKETAKVRVRYFENIAADCGKADIAYRLKTPLRRYLSEFRDNYLSQSDFLHKSATWISQRLKGSSA